MRKWKASVHSLQDRFKEEVDNESTSCRDSADDSLSVDSDKIIKNMNFKELKFLKRGIIRSIERIYDILVLISPFVARAKDFCKTNRYKSIQIEAIFNSRPLFGDPHQPKPVAFRHLSLGRRLLTLPQTKIIFPESD